MGLFVRWDEHNQRTPEWQQACPPWRGTEPNSRRVAIIPTRGILQNEDVSEVERGIPLSAIGLVGLIITLVLRRSDLFRQASLSKYKLYPRVGRRPVAFEDFHRRSVGIMNQAAVLCGFVLLAGLTTRAVALVR